MLFYTLFLQCLVLQIVDYGCHICCEVNEYIFLWLPRLTGFGSGDAKSDHEGAVQTHHGEDPEDLRTSTVQINGSFDRFILQKGENRLIERWQVSVLMDSVTLFRFIQSSPSLESLETVQLAPLSRLCER